MRVQAYVFGTGYGFNMVSGVKSAQHNEIGDRFDIRALREGHAWHRATVIQRFDLESGHLFLLSRHIEVPDLASQRQGHVGVGLALAAADAAKIIGPKNRNALMAIIRALSNANEALESHQLARSQNDMLRSFNRIQLEMSKYFDPLDLGARIYLPEKRDQKISAYILDNFQGSEVRLIEHGLWTDHSSKAAVKIYFQYEPAMLGSSLRVLPVTIQSLGEIGASERRMRTLRPLKIANSAARKHQGARTPNEERSTLASSAEIQRVLEELHQDIEDLESAHSKRASALHSRISNLESMLGAQSRLGGAVAADQSAIRSSWPNDDEPVTSYRYSAIRKIMPPVAGVGVAIGIVALLYFAGLGPFSKLTPPQEPAITAAALPKTALNRGTGPYKKVDGRNAPADINQCEVARLSTLVKDFATGSLAVQTRVTKESETKQLITSCETYIAQVDREGFEKFTTSTGENCDTTVTSSMRAYISFIHSQAGVSQREQQKRLTEFMVELNRAINECTADKSLPRLNDLTKTKNLSTQETINPRKSSAPNAGKHKKTSAEPPQPSGVEDSNSPDYAPSDW